MYVQIYIHKGCIGCGDTKIEKFEFKVKKFIGNFVNLRNDMVMSLQKVHVERKIL